MLVMLRVARSLLPVCLQQECVDLLIYSYDRCEAEVLDEAADATQTCRLDELANALDCMRGAGCPTGNISKWQACDAIRTDSWYTCPQPSDAVMMQISQTCG